MKKFLKGSSSLFVVVVSYMQVPQKKTNKKIRVKKKIAVIIVNAF